MHELLTKWHSQLCLVCYSMCRRSAARGGEDSLSLSRSCLWCCVPLCTLSSLKYLPLLQALTTSAKCWLPEKLFRGEICAGDALACFVCFSYDSIFYINHAETSEARRAQITYYLLYTIFFYYIFCCVLQILGQGLLSGIIDLNK